jgi:hypothetical protein
MNRKRKFATTIENNMLHAASTASANATVTTSNDEGAINIDGGIIACIEDTDDAIICPYNFDDDPEKINKCSGCGEVGHNYRTCHNKNVGYMLTNCNQWTPKLLELIKQDPNNNGGMVNLFCNKYCSLSLRCNENKKITNTPEHEEPRLTCNGKRVTYRPCCDLTIYAGKKMDILSGQLSNDKDLNECFDFFMTFNCSFCGWTHEKTFDAVHSKTINECPLDYQSYVNRTKSCVGKERLFFTIGKSKYRSTRMNDDQENTIGEGLFANVDIPAGTTLAFFKGVVVTDPDESIMTLHKGYLLQLSKNKEYLDCYEARHNSSFPDTEKCYASFANSACGLRDPNNLGITPRNNAEIMFSPKPYLRSIRNIKKGEEILASYGNGFFRN